MIYGFWDYWNLRHKVTFDGPNKLIRINPGVTILNAQQDIYSAWKEWSLYELNTKYLQAISTVGGEPTVAGQRLDVTYFLINGWKIKPQPGSYRLSIIGNIFDIDGAEPVLPADNIPGIANNININTNTSVIVRLVQASGGSLTSEQSAALFNIEDKVIEIKSLLQAPLQAEIVGAQANILTDLQSKITELWKIHGLDATSPVTVTQETRTLAGITQNFEKTTDTVVITRL